jgi:hypothetical protein
MKTNHPALPRCSRPSHDDVLRDQIGARLKNDYAQMLGEPLPDRFGALLDELKASSAHLSADIKK